MFHFRLVCALLSFIIIFILSWETLKVIVNTCSPLCVIRSNSMAPFLRQGDAIFITNFTSQPLQVGDVVVFKLPSYQHPIVHRIRQIRQKKRRKRKRATEKRLNILTKGDQNWFDDKLLYKQHGLDWLGRENVMGKVRIVIPFIGKLKDLLFGSFNARVRKK